MMESPFRRYRRIKSARYFTTLAGGKGSQMLFTLYQKVIMSQQRRGIEYCKPNNIQSPPANHTISRNNAQ